MISAPPQNPNRPARFKFARHSMSFADSVRYAATPLCDAQRDYNIVAGGDNGLNGKRATCANAADTCDGVHNDMVHRILWSSPA